jgi:hypothetical protein
MQDSSLRNLGEKARAVISEQRDWNQIVPVCNEIYKAALVNARSRG